MTIAVQEELRAFATEVLQRRGGLVDWPGDAREGTAVLPPSAAEVLGGEEMLRLTVEPGQEGWCVSLATEFLETAGRLLAAEPRTGSFGVGELYRKGGNVDEAVRRAFTWLNAKVELCDTRAVDVDYDTWWFLATLSSEDRWQARFPVTINAASDAEVELPDPLGLWQIRPHPARGPAAGSTYTQAVGRAAVRVRAAADEFFRRMDARIGRDRSRLREYYRALLREADPKKPRGGVQPDPEKIAARKRAVELELRRKLAELDERYAIAAALEPLVLVRTAIPALAVDLWVHRKRARRKHTVYWNALVKQFEPICCSRCGSGAMAVSFSDEDVAPLCPGCSR